MNGLASEFFYEVFRHLIPGLVILILYWHKEMAEVFLRYRNFISPYVVGVFALLIAWLIGVVFELITSEHGLGWLLRLVRKSPVECDENSPKEATVGKALSDESWLSFSVSLALGEKGRKASLPQEYKEDDDWPKEWRRQLYLAGGMMTMCRCLWMIFFISAVYSPEPFSLPPFLWSQY